MLFKKNDHLNDEMDRVLFILEETDPSTEAYTNAVKNYEVLAKARSHEPSNQLRPDTILLAAVNLLGIVLVLQNEQAHVITSKAFSFLIKPKF